MEEKPSLKNWSVLWNLVYVFNWKKFWHTLYSRSFCLKLFKTSSTGLTIHKNRKNKLQKSVNWVERVTKNYWVSTNNNDLTCACLSLSAIIWFTLGRIYQKTHEILKNFHDLLDNSAVVFWQKLNYLKIYW